MQVIGLSVAGEDLDNTVFCANPKNSMYVKSADIDVAKIIECKAIGPFDASIRRWASKTRFAFRTPCNGLQCACRFIEFLDHVSVADEKVAVEIARN